MQLCNGEGHKRRCNAWFFSVLELENRGNDGGEFLPSLIPVLVTGILCIGIVL